MLKLLNSKATKNLFYVQFPDGLPPAEIYGGTWREHRTIRIWECVEG